MSEDARSALLRAASEALGEVTKTALGLEARIGREGSTRPRRGAVIALRGDVSLELRLFASEPSLDALARALLGVDEGESITSEDTADGIAELVNMLAGGLKRRVLSLHRTELGVPVFVDDVPEVDAGALGAIVFDIGGAAATLVLFEAA